MRKSKFRKHQTIATLKAVDAARTVKDVWREHEITDATYYQWESEKREFAHTLIFIRTFSLSLLG